MRNRRLLLSAIALIPAAGPLSVHADDSAAPAERMGRYNVVWDRPSQDASGVMPIGNGDIAAGVYAIENGDLYLLLAKNDAYTYQGDIFKTGRVRIAMSPNPFTEGKPFRQTLDLPTGSIRIEAGGVSIRLWADAHRPVYHVEIAADDDITIAAQPDLWQRFDRCGYNYGAYPAAMAAAAGKEPTQDVRVDRDGRMLWYYAVGDRSIYPDDLRAYQVEHMGDSFADPFRFNTFGNLLEGEPLVLADGVLRGVGRRFHLRVHALTLQAPEPERWIEAIGRQAARTTLATDAWKAHCAWWAGFWNRSWIVASDRTLPNEARERLHGEPSPGGLREEEDGAAVVAQSYNVFRFLMACQSRGRVQAKFNGGLFTQQLKVGGHREHAAKQPDGSFLTHEDDRLWGRRFTFQNQRLLYWPLLAGGDFDLLQPFFDYYSDLLPMRRAITRAWFGHDGAYFRENLEPTGAERESSRPGTILPPKTKPGESYDGWYHDYYFTSGLEITAMMLEYVKLTGDAAFRDQVLVPFAREVLLFFDRHYPRDAAGKLRLDPAQVVETWWAAVNPAPDVAGLRFCLESLLRMSAGTADDQAQWRKFLAEIPEVHLHRIEGRQAIAPAERWSKLHNHENGELYPVFPFRLYGLGFGTTDLVEWTLKHRTARNAFGYTCWTQDQIHWAYAGNAAEAAHGLEQRFRIASSMCRFPLYGRESPDSCPDLDHFGAGSVALQRMLVQEAAGGKILLLPAWPAEWDADFKLHVAGGAVLTGTVRDGKLAAWDITPAARRGDVIVRAPQPTACAFPPIPANSHPFRVGSDQNNQNRFQGKIGRVTLFRGRLSPERIQQLAAGDRAQPVTGADVVQCRMEPAAADILPTVPEDFAGPVSIEAWIHPAAREEGRIVDKLTAGIDDGVLFDTWPGLSLRLIVGNRRHEFREVLQAGAWQHVAVVIDRGSSRVFLDGKPLARTEVSR